ncbi:phosphatidylglycerol lysyltransferase domain-containing protein [Actinophytocola sp.]|jgi:lysyl-tRNA synthetase class 2|uniref:phosphatidylglycerol lysyltransferase domain-containing protein n=1 Tax=Actinophytocola sp. TaxID=1872138 RepID=UPI002ED8B0B7
MSNVHDGQNGRAIAIVAWLTRAAGVLAVLAAVLPGRRLLRSPVAEWLGLPPEVTLAAAAAMAVAGAGLVSLATGLRRRKRRAWQLAVLLTGAVTGLQLVLHHRYLPSLVPAALLLGLLVVLLANGDRFTAVPDPAIGRWYAIRVFVQFAAIGVAIDFVLLMVQSNRLVGTPPTGARLAHSVLALGGVTGPVRFTSLALDDLTAVVGLVFGVTAVVLGGYFLLRSAEPAPSMSAEDQQRLRALLATQGGHDSLGYFALRSDKSVVFSPTGKAAVTYRTLAGVALSSGDPLGDPEAWPGAITGFLDTCARFGWVPAVLGCSTRGATVYNRHGLRVLELGDEAVVDVDQFTLHGRAMRDARKMVTRARKAGYRVDVRTVAELHPAEREMLAELMERWRGSEPDRGYSMALGRAADPRDADCVLVTASCEGQVRGLLQFVPWGPDGLSLDLMRRDRTSSDSGLNELMIIELLESCAALGVRRVSLNFAVFRAALARGERIGAGPIDRMWARLLRLGSRWWQIESLYRFNAKFAPTWVPRYIAFPAGRELPRIVLAAMEAEGFGGRPRLLRSALSREPLDAVPEPVAS